MKRIFVKLDAASSTDTAYVDLDDISSIKGNGSSWDRCVVSMKNGDKFYAEMSASKLVASLQEAEKSRNNQ